MADDAIEIEFDITLEDAVEFSLWDWKKTITYKKRVSVILLLSALIVLLLYYLFSLTHFDPWYMFFYGFCSGVVFLVFYLMVIMPSVTRKTVLKKLSESRNRILLTHHKMRFDVSGVSTQTELSNATVNWDGIEKIIRGESAVYIYLTGMMAWIIPD